MIQEGQGEADDAGSTALGDGGVPVLGEHTNLRQCHEGKPRQGNGKGHEESGEAIRSADLDRGQTEAAFGVFE